MKDMLAISQEDLGMLCITAIRYCHGRQTYMPGLIQGICKQYLKSISDKDLGVMLEDCDFQERVHLFGDERIDKPGWLVWKKCLEDERERRKDAARS